MKYLLILSVLFFVSCSSSSKKKESKADDEFAEIENSDFKAPKQVPFVPNLDSFVGEESNYDSLSSESIARLPQPKLETFELSDDPLTKSLSYCYRKQYAKGFALLDNIYRKYEKHPGYWNQVGTCYLLKGELRKALLYYNKSLGIKSNYSPPVNNLGVIYQREGKDQKALMAYKRAARINKFSLTPLYNLAQLYLKYGFVDKAQKTFKILLDKKPSDTDALNGVATCMLMNGNSKGAVSVFERIDKNELRRAAISINFALALKSTGRTDDAKTVISMASDFRDGTERSYFNKVRTHVEN